MTESLLHRVRVVLFEPQDPVNIAATVRAMKNMGVRDLVLVRPVEYTAYRLEGIAHDTLDIIERIRNVDTLDEALADCVHVAAFTARRRRHKWDLAAPREMADRLLTARRGWHRWRSSSGARTTACPTRPRPRAHARHDPHDQPRLAQPGAGGARRRSTNCTSPPATPRAWSPPAA